MPRIACDQRALGTCRRGFQLDGAGGENVAMGRPVGSPQLRPLNCEVHEVDGEADRHRQPTTSRRSSGTRRRRRSSGTPCSPRSGRWRARNAHTPGSAGTTFVRQCSWVSTATRTTRRSARTRPSPARGSTSTNDRRERWPSLISLAECTVMRQPFAVLGRFQGVVDDDFAGRFDELYGIVYRAASTSIGTVRGGGLFAGSARTSAGEMEENARLRGSAWVARVSVNLACSIGRVSLCAHRLAPLAATAASADRYDLAARRRDPRWRCRHCPAGSVKPWRCGTSLICPRPRPPARWVARWAR